MDELDTERVTYCMGALGSARRALEIAAEYATKRVQFKQPIAMFEGVSFKLAEMYAALDAARQVTYRTAKMIEAGLPAQRESAVTKLVVAENVWKIVDHAMQVLGGIGYTTDFPIQADLPQRAPDADRRRLGRDHEVPHRARAPEGDWGAEVEFTPWPSAPSRPPTSRRSPGRGRRSPRPG